MGQQCLYAQKGSGSGHLLPRLALSRRGGNRRPAPSGSTGEHPGSHRAGAEAARQAPHTALSQGKCAELAGGPVHSAAGCRRGSLPALQEKHVSLPQRHPAHHLHSLAVAGRKLGHGSPPPGRLLSARDEQASSRRATTALGPLPRTPQGPQTPGPTWSPGLCGQSSAEEEAVSCRRGWPFTHSLPEPGRGAGTAREREDLRDDVSPARHASLPRPPSQINCWHPARAFSPGSRTRPPFSAGPPGLRECWEQVLASYEVF